MRPSIGGSQYSQFPTGNYVPPPTVFNALVTPAGVTLSFTDNSFGLARNVIQRSTSASGPFYDVITLPAGVTSYLNVEVPPGTYYYRVFAITGNGSSSPSNVVSLTVTGSATGAQYRFTPPPIGTREFQIVNIPTTGLDTGTGAGQRYVITFATNSGYLLLAPPDSAITGMVDIETNAQTVVLHGAEFLPDFAVEKATGPAGNLTVGKVLDIFTTGSNSPEIYLYKNKFRTTDDNGNVVWNAGDPINVGGFQSSDNTKWPLTYMEQNWVDNLYGFAIDTVGHTDVIKSNSGPVRGFRIARNRWACSYQFFILFTGHNETWGAYPGGTNQMFDNQWYSINPPPSWSEPVANNLYLSTSYTNQVSNGFYHAYMFKGTGAGGTDGYGTYIDMSGNTQDTNLGQLMSPPVGYGFQLNGNNLEAIAGQPPANRNNNQDWCQGNVYFGDHPKLGDLTTHDRPVLRTETGTPYRITTRAQLEALIGSTVIPPTLGTPSMTSDGANIPFTGGSGFTTLIPQWSNNSGSTWNSIANDTTSPLTFTGLSPGNYSFRALADGTVASNIVTGVVPSSTSTPLYSSNFDASSVGTTLTSLGFVRTSGIVTNEQLYLGTKSAKHSITFNTDGDQSYGCARTLQTPLAQGDEIWVRAKFFFPTGWDFGNAGNGAFGGTAPRTKFFRLHTRTSGGAHLGYNDLYLWKEDATVTKWQWIYEGVQQWAYSGLDGWAPGRPAAPTTGIVRNGWVNIEYYIKLHATPGQALVRVWVDNVLQVTITDLATLVNATDVADEWQYATYWNGGAPATQSMYTDKWDVYTSANPPTNFDANGFRFIGS